MLSSRYYSASRVGTNPKPRSALIVDDDEDLYTGFNEVSPALDTRALREDQAFQEALKTASIGRKLPSRMGTAMFRQGTVNVQAASSRPGTTAAGRPMTAVRAAGYTSTARSTPTYEEKKEESIEDKIKQMESRIMSLVEESCMLSVRPSADDGSARKREYDLGKALGKAQEASALERQLIRMQEQANLGDSHNLDLTFAVLCNLAEHYALNEMYSEALNTYQLLTRNKLFPHANRLKVNMGNIYFKMGEHPKALKLYRMALDQTPTAEKDLRMKVMHNIGLLLVRMGKFRDAVTNFQHIMHEQGDFQTGLNLVLCSVALNDAEGCKAAFHAMLDVEPPTYHQDITVDDVWKLNPKMIIAKPWGLIPYKEKDAFEAVMRDVIRVDRLSRWSRHVAASAERCLALAAAAAASINVQHADSDTGMSWCVEALRGYDAGGGGGAGARLELSAALASLRTGGVKAENGVKALQRLKAVARAHNNDTVVKSEANADAAFVAYALSNWSDANSLASAAAAADAYSCVARVTSALATAKVNDLGLAGVTSQLAAAARLDVACLTAAHDLALSLEASEEPDECARAEGRWSVVRGASGATSLRAFAAAGLARAHANRADYTAAEHWYSTIGSWDVSVASALAQIHSELGDLQAAKHHYQDIEAVWPCDISALEWLGAEARNTEPHVALQYYQRAARLQPNNPQWGLLIGACLRASGKYQEALAVYKKMNIRFPDNVPCLKLIVKLCGDQGLAETAQWNRELQRAQARLKQQERATVPSAGSISSGTSQSPIDYIKDQQRTDSATILASSRSQLSTASSSGARATSGKNDHGSLYGDNEPRSINRSLRSAPRKKKVDDFDEELPLPPE